MSEEPLVVPDLPRPEFPLCSATTLDGKPCPVRAQINGLCAIHHTNSLPKEERHKLAVKSGSQPKPMRVPLHTAKDVLVYCERLAADVSSSTVELADTKVRIAMLALKAQERLEAEKAQNADGMNRRLGRTG